MKVYLAGPMRGLPDWNFPEFDRAREAWQKAGHHVFCPAALVRAMGYPLDGPAEPDTEAGRQHLRHVILSDVACILQADALVLLPGWEGSRGCTVEVALAQFLGLPLFDATKPFTPEDARRYQDTLKADLDVGLSTADRLAREKVEAAQLDPDRCPWQELNHVLQNWQPKPEHLRKFVSTR